MKFNIILRKILSSSRNKYVLSRYIISTSCLTILRYDNLVNTIKGKSGYHDK